MRGKKSLAEKLRHIIVVLAMPLVGCIILEMAVFGIYVYRYAKITHNVNVSSTFSKDFKDNIDLKTYHYVVKSREQTGLPTEDVDEALKLANDLAKTTEYKESCKSIRNVAGYCESLKEDMYRIDEASDYDTRMQMLENNVYVLTNLIEDETMNYIYYEAKYLSVTEARMVQYIIAIFVTLFLVIAGLLLQSWRRAVGFIEGVTEPVRRLCENVREVGMGHFDIPPVDSSDYEIEQLDSGIQNMAGKIAGLLENARQEEKLRHMTQLQLLQAQINPHFLYNTLDTIVWMLEADMHDKASQMQTNLPVFFSTALSAAGPVIPLAEEMRHTKSYLDIQQVRYRDILDYRIELPEELREYRIPKLSLQPLVENALYHGVKEKRGSSTITITCRREGGDILISVSDDGIGMTPEQLKRAQDGINLTGDGGFGLSAVEGRIRLYCGEGYGFTITSEYGRGTEVILKISGNIQPIA